MRYNKIRKMDISNGPGIRVSIFMQGCTFNCKECFNPSTHDFNGGEEFTQDTIDQVLEICSDENISGLSILGGEPMHPKNIEGTGELAKQFKERFPDKSVWVWSGFTFDRDLKDKEELKYIDVLVDGQFVNELRDPRLKYRGSSNQRVIDIKKTKKNMNIYIQKLLIHLEIYVILKIILLKILKKSRWKSSPPAKTCRTLNRVTL